MVVEVLLHCSALLSTTSSLAQGPVTQSSHFSEEMAPSKGVEGKRESPLAWPHRTLCPQLGFLGKYNSPAIDSDIWGGLQKGQRPGLGHSEFDKLQVLSRWALGHTWKNIGINR